MYKYELELDICFLGKVTVTLESEEPETEEQLSDTVAELIGQLDGGDVSIESIKEIQ